MCAWQTRQRVSATYIGSEFFCQWPRRTELQLYFFGSVLTNIQRKLGSKHVDDCLVEFVASNARRIRGHNATHRNHCNFCRSTADVHDQTRARKMHWKSGANCCSHWFFNDVHRSTCTSKLCGLLHCAAFDASNFGRHTNNHSWLIPSARVHLLNEITKHLFAHIKISNHSVLQRAHQTNILRSTSPHSLGLKTNGHEFTCSAVNSHRRRFIEHDSFALYIHKCVGGAQVDGDVTS